MTETEFISHWVGTRWVERGNTEQGIDCWALVVRYYADVLGIELDNGYPADIAAGFATEVESGCWVPTDKNRGVVFMCFDRAGHPMHVGLVVADGKFILHAREPAVRCDRIEIMRRFDMQFFEYKGRM